MVFVLKEVGLWWFNISEFLFFFLVVLFFLNMIHDKITSRLKDEKSKYRSLSFLLRAKILVWAIFYAQGVTMIAFLIDPKLPKNVPLNFVFLIMFYVSAIAASSEYKSKSEEKEDKPNTEKSKE